jgi:hypothetical protein
MDGYRFTLQNSDIERRLYLTDNLPAGDLRQLSLTGELGKTYYCELSGYPTLTPNLGIATFNATAPLTNWISGIDWLSTPTLANSWAASGQNLARLESLRLQVERYEAYELGRVTEYLEAIREDAAGELGTPYSCLYAFQPWSDSSFVAEQPQPSSVLIEPLALLTSLRYLRHLELVKKLVYRRVQSIRKVVNCFRPRFCGLSWTKRPWFLLHGSHPPKAAACLVFGCA